VAAVEVKVTAASDFVSCYAAGKLVLASVPQFADAAALCAPHQYFFYPPV